MFLTGMAPNLLAVELVRRTVNVDITWMQWFTSFAPVGILLLLALPPLVYLFCPPTIKRGNEVAAWAAEQLHGMGTLSRRKVRVMMGLAPYIGRQDAHDVVYAACQTVNDQGGTLASVLSSRPGVSSRLDQMLIE